MAAREKELLPVPYFHVVFTLPREIARLATARPRVIYDLLFRASSEAMQQVALDEEHLAAEIGFLSVLHTWGLLRGELVEALGVDLVRVRRLF